MEPVFISALRDFRVKKLIPRCTKLIEDFFRDNIDFAKVQHTIMVVGVPNVGMDNWSLNTFVLIASIFQPTVEKNW